jgi:Ran GTPase-activating protein (RanGAP) involved in mRNA processing and transport
MMQLNPSLTSLHLRGNDFGAAGMPPICAALCRNLTLVDLDLSSNAIGTDGAIALSQALRVNSNVVRLGLGRNRIGMSGTTGVAVLFEALRANSSIRYLGFEHNRLAAMGTVTLSTALMENANLQSLHLGGNAMGDRGARAIAAALRVNSSLQRLGLGTNEISGEGVAELCTALCESNSCLKHLDLGHNRIGADGVAAICAALATWSVRQLNLEAALFGERGLLIGDESVCAIGDALRLTTLAGSRLQPLESLNLGGNEIGPVGAMSLFRALETDSSLTQLDMGDNRIGPAGVASLGAALRVNATLRHLCLVRCGIGNEGAIALGEAIGCGGRGGDSVATEFDSSNRACVLEYIDLASNEVGDEGVEALCAALCRGGCPSLRKLVLYRNRCGLAGATALAAVLRLPRSSLQHLNLSENLIPTAGAIALLDSLCINNALLQLVVAKNRISDCATFVAAASRAIGANTSLLHLDLNRNQVDAKTMAVLQNDVEHRGVPCVFVSWKEEVSSWDHGDAGALDS